MACPDKSQIQLFYEGKLTLQEMQVVFEHIEACRPCSDVLAKLLAPIPEPVLGPPDVDEFFAELLFTRGHLR